MWTAENRGKYDRTGQRYPSDVTDEEWALVEPHLPTARRVDRREVLNAILYVLTTGCQWRQLPKDFPPKSTVHDYFVEWHCDGILTRIHHALHAQVRELAGRRPTATTAIVDSQSVKGAEKGGSGSMLPATMRARKSRARSATSRSTRWA
jgi:transposase